mmetsp:Transcript_7676/g.16886  ORF Transcript_7676/g.16886 Transcript_7676/m.16886 type:complete len:450 (+) Transcript_7676:132-1481(+)
MNGSSPSQAGIPQRGPSGLVSAFSGSVRGSSSTLRTAPTDESGQDEDEVFDSPFMRRRMRVWQPVLSPRWVLGSLCVLGLIFVVTGACLLVAAKGIVEYSEDYTRLASADGVGEFEILIDEAMEPPIWIYYKLDGFYQNHRRHMKSLDYDQLKKGSGASELQEDDLDQCKPEVLSSSGKVLYPCGKKAESVFNDTFRLQVQDPDSASWELLEVDSSASAIAWESDIDGERFKNMDPEAVGEDGRQNQVALDMWILNRFPPVTCEQVDFETMPHVPVYVAVQERSTGATTTPTVPGQLQNVTACTGYTSSSPSCSFTRLGQPFDCADGSGYRLVQHDDWGVESGHFIVWMRTAGLPGFRKPWGKITRKLEAGSTLKVHFSDDFNLDDVGESAKVFIISTGSTWTGKTPYLGGGYVLIGSCCIILSCAFGLVQYARPRSLGDLQVLSKREC